MFVTIDFKEDYVKAAIADNYAIPIEEVDLNAYSESEIADSIDWHIKKGAGKDIDLNDVCAVRKNSIMRTDFEMGCVNSDGKLVKGSEFVETVLYNSGQISSDELESLVKSGEYQHDPRIIVTTPDRGDNLQTTEFYKKFEIELEEPDQDLEQE